MDFPHMIHTSTGCPTLGHMWWRHPGESCLGSILEHHLLAFPPGTLQASTKPKVTFFPQIKPALIVGSRQAALGGGLEKTWGHYEHPNKLGATWA